MNRKLRIRTIASVAAIGATLLFSGATLAAHDHYLVTPGTCVKYIARGQTAQTDGGGEHRFHDNVHLGQPGTVAFGNPANPVAVYKVGLGPGCS